MAQLVLTPPASDLCRLAGVRTFQQGLGLARSGGVEQLAGDAPSGRLLGEVADGARRVTVVVTFEADGVGGVAGLAPRCSCGAAGPCAHAVALCLAALAPGMIAGAPTVGAPIAGAPIAGAPIAGVPTVEAEPPAWVAAVSSLLGEPAADVSGRSHSGPAPEPAPEPQVALQFSLDRPQRGSGRFRVGVRPVLRGRHGAWVRTGISWSNVQYSYGYHQRRPPLGHLQLLRELHGLCADGYRYVSGSVIHLDEIGTRRVWDLLAEATEQGLPLVTAGKRGGPVVVHPAVAARAVVARREGGLGVRPEVWVDGVGELPGDAVQVGGEVPALGWTAQGPADVRLHLAPVPRELVDDLEGLRESPEIVVPPGDETDFFERFYPRLVSRLPVVATDDVVLPRPDPARLVVQVAHEAGHRATVRWRWSVRFGSSVAQAPLRPGRDERGGTVPAGWRDPEAEAALEAEAAAVAQVVPELVEAAPGPTGRTGAVRLRPETELTGPAAARLHTEALPKLALLDGVDLDVRGVVPGYREPEAEPVVRFTSSQEGRDTDWFDLAVSVTVDGRTLPFVELFVALARGDDVLVTDDGTIVRLRTERFAKLVELIREARSLEESEPGALRVSRYQAGIWHDVAEVGELTGPAHEWRGAVRAVLDSREASLAEPPPVPRGIAATLRPYQVEGFAWLSTLYRYRLGGILADDMGLGKTLQTLALICHAREEQGVTRPFLVVAPTSVVGTWVSEAARFAPGLRVAAVTRTRAKRGVALRDLVEGADVVVTSYTLLRLEAADYGGIDWAGKILDEAQFAKNHRTKAHQALRELPAPFSLAITGTPMENNLMELWAMFAVTSPGLLSQASRFMEFYRTPIESARDTERLALLRARIRPLMLRRTKEQVAADLPEKQEQVLRLELNDAHRRAYDTYLHRERQKVLKLLTDLNKHRFEILRSLTVLRQASLDVALVGRAPGAKPAAVPSTKLDALMELVGDIAAEGHRVLVFSQFTRFLAAARARLEAAGVECCYLDGSTRNRHEVIDGFRTGDAPVFLISLKAGGFGLTLTEADYCILLDPWWNPAAEAQAVDRVHRIGQRRTVMVYRLVAKDTIEEKVLALQERKRELFHSVMDDGGFESSQLSEADIRSLLE